MKTIKITDDGKLKTSEIIEKMKSKFPVCVSNSCGELAKYIQSCLEPIPEARVSVEDTLDKQFPAPEVPTERYFMDSEEPDTDTLGLSINETLEKEIKQEEGITLRERLIMELDYFDKTGKHLDVKGLTFCSGSRSSRGGVPSVYLSTNGDVYVGWDYLGDSGSSYGIRRAVSLDTSLENAIKICKENGLKVYKVETVTKEIEV